MTLSLTASLVIRYPGRTTRTPRRHMVSLFTFARSLKTPTIVWIKRYIGIYHQRTFLCVFSYRHHRWDSSYRRLSSDVCSTCFKLKGLLLRFELNILDLATFVLTLICGFGIGLDTVCRLATRKQDDCICAACLYEWRMNWRTDRMIYNKYLL